MFTSLTVTAVTTYHHHHVLQNDWGKLKPEFDCNNNTLKIPPTTTCQQPIQCTSVHELKHSTNHNVDKVLN